MENFDVMDVNAFDALGDGDSVDEYDEATGSDEVMTAMSIWKLRFENHNSSSSENIREMINTYNSNLVDKEQYILEYKVGCIEVYKQTKSTKSKLELIHGTKVINRTSNNFISVFYTNDGNIYAQTTGYAWRVVCNYGDTDFPDRISRRLLDRKGMKSQSRRPISGNTVYQQKRSRNPERSNLTAKQNVLVSFTADLRENASIRGLNCFSKPNKKIMVRVGGAFVSFSDGIKRSGIDKVINHLNKIYNQEKTYTTDGSEEKDTNAFAESLKIVDNESTKILDATLREHMKKYIQGNQEFMEHLNDFDLCQGRSMATFSYGCNFKINFKGTVFKFDQLPTLEIALNEIKQIYTASSDLGTNDEIVINISYDCNGRKCKRRLFHLIEGTMMKMNQMYYRLENKWYYMNEDYIRAIHIGFRGLLRDRLITDGPILQKQWINCDEGDYNNAYMNSPNFLVGDYLTYGNIELFDLLQYDHQSGHIYLYYVKKGLDRNTRTLTSQVRSAVDILDKSFTNAQDSSLLEYYESIKMRYATENYMMPAFCDTFKKFQSLLSKKNNLKIVCAIFLPGKYGILSKEKDAVDSFGPPNIAKAIDNLHFHKKKSLATYFDLKSHMSFNLSCRIFKSLIDNKYVKVSNVRRDYGSSTSKLLLAHRNERGNTDSSYFSICKPPNQYIDGIVWELIEPYSSYFISTAAKHSLMDMNEAGFDFQICEIDGYFEQWYLDSVRNKNNNRPITSFNDRNRSSNYQNGHKYRN